MLLLWPRLLLFTCVYATYEAPLSPKEDEQDT